MLIADFIENLQIGVCSIILFCVKKLYLEKHHKYIPQQNRGFSSQAA